MADSENEADGFVRNPRLMKEQKAVQATGAESRFMTSLQRILILLLGSQFVCKNRDPTGFIKKEILDEVLNVVEQAKAEIWRAEIWRAEKSKQYSSLLKYAQSFGESFAALSTPTKLDVKKHRSIVRDSLWNINKLLDELYAKWAQCTRGSPRTRVTPKKAMQRSLVADKVRSILKKNPKLMEKTGEPFSAEQSAILEKFIPQLNTMVVSDIIASLELTMAELEAVVICTGLYYREGFPESNAKGKPIDYHVYCERHERNFSNHMLEIEDVDHDEFLKHAKCIMEFVEPWFPDTSTDSFDEMTPDEKLIYPSFVYPWLRETCLDELRTTLSTRHVLNTVTNRVVTSNEEKEEITRLLVEKDTLLAKETMEKEEWKDLYMNSIASPQENLGGAAKGNPPSGSDDESQQSDNDIPEVVKGMQDIQLASTEDQAYE